MSKRLSVAIVLLLSLTLCVPLLAQRAEQPLKLTKIAKALSSSEQIRTKTTLTPPSTILTIDVEDVVAYVADVPFDQIASVQAQVALGRLLPVANVSLLGDIRFVNGEPVKGTWLFRGIPFLAEPFEAPGSGVSVADTSRLAVTDHAFEFLQEDGTVVGTIFGFGLGFGPSPPGSPLKTKESNEAIIGGTGAYLGMRGQMGTDGNATPRFTSAAEDPALRRQIGGGLTRWIFHLLPLFPPEVVLVPHGTRERTGLYHEDGSLVTGSNPASPEEELRLLATNIGPTNPGVNPGQPFPVDPVSAANSPVVVRIGGEDVAAGAWGVPGAVNLYEVAFTVPATLSSTTQARLVVAFVKGSSFVVHVD